MMETTGVFHCEERTSECSVPSSSDEPTIASLPKALIPAGELLKIKRRAPNIELTKLPKFGAKLTTASTVYSNKKVKKRLDKIYSCKQQAFEYPRFLEVSLQPSDASTPPTGTVGILDTFSLNVTVDGFRGGFSQYFGKTRMDAERGLNVTTLNPYEAFFLADAGFLEVAISPNCPLGIEDFRAMLEAKYPEFPTRYAVFSEFHRATQMYLKPFGFEMPVRRGMKRKLIDVEEPAQPETADALASPSTSKAPFVRQEPLSELPQLIPRRPIQLEGINSIDLLNIDEIGSASTLSKDDEMDCMPQSLPSMSSEDAEIEPRFDLLLEKPAKDVRIQETTVHAGPIDLAFTCFSKPTHGVPAQASFDVAISDARNKNIKLSDLFSALSNRKNRHLPLYVSRTDNGYLSGFASQLADVPTVLYHGFP